MTFTTLEQIGAATQGDPFNHRPYQGFYGPEARLNLMMGVEAGWAGAQDAYDYLYQFIGINPAACGNVGNGDDRPDLACRAGWALDFYEPVAVDNDADDDGVLDDDDNCAAVPNGSQANHDADAFGDACDTDDDNDSFDDATENAAGSDPLNSASTPEICDGIDNDLNNGIDEGFLDIDNDGLASCTDPDDDGDGFSDDAEIAAGSNPFSNASTPEVCDGADNDLDGTIDEGSLNTDGDLQANCVDEDDDNDGVLDGGDRFPLDMDESVDTDGDGTGNNADADDDSDGVLDAADRFPLDLNESVDTDGDGTGNNADADDDSDGVLDAADRFPLDLNESVDTDGDGTGNNADADDDDDGVLDAADRFPLDVNESVDTDGDGTGNNADTDDDSDGVLDAADAFPLDLNESVDTDGDGTGNNADTDDDGDGVLDAADALPARR